MHLKPFLDRTSKNLFVDVMTLRALPLSHVGSFLLAAK
jgi:hypothetical protein